MKTQFAKDHVLNKNFDPASPEFAARRAEARKILDALDPARTGGIQSADPLRQEWFEAVYRLADNDPARVPWGNLAPHPLTEAWVGGQVRGISGLRTLDVGCGLGDNAECLSAAGAHVTAFDFVGEAVDWAKRRFPNSKVAYHVADLFSMPETWRRAFDLVHECYTLQAFSPELVPQALAALETLLAPGGKLLIVARARDEDSEVAGPPWPLPPSVFTEAERRGLKLLALEDIYATSKLSIRHWRAVLGRAGDPAQS